MTIPILPRLLLDPSDRRPLVEQIHAALAHSITSRNIEPSARLPATRNLARELGVSRSTVVHAYEQLAAEGFVEARAGAGYFVCDVGDVEEVLSNPLADRHVATSRGTVVASESVRREFPGLPDMRLFPHAAWSKHIVRSARLSAEAMLGTPDPFGLPRLREAIALHIAAWRGIEAAPDQIVVTAGAADALELALRTLADGKRCVALENPTYQPLRRMAAERGLDIHWLEVGEAGALLPTDHVKAQLTILTPSYQFPLGGAMPRNQRMAFLERAERDDGWIIEDDFDSEFRYAGRPIPALASLDGVRRVVYVGSFSKIFSTSLRLGYAVIPESLLPAFRQTITRFGSKASVVTQWPIATFIEDGSFHRHIRRMRRIYGERRQAVVESLKVHLPSQVTFRDHRAGMQIALHFPDAWNDLAVSDEAVRLGVNCLPLSPFYQAGPARSGLLLGFSSVPPAEADDRVSALGRVLRGGSPYVPDLVRS